MTRANSEVLIALLIKSCCSMGEMNLWWGESTRTNFD